MRRHLVVLAAVLGVSGIAAADKAPEVQLDNDARDSLVILTDGDGHYIAITPPQKKGETLKHFYYGDAKRLWAQRSHSAGRFRDSAWSRKFWSPRSRRDPVLFRNKDGSWGLTCDGTSDIPLKVASNAKKIRKGARFYERRFRRRVLFMARDEEANYYVVDADLVEGDLAQTDLRGLRFYRGPAGKMARLRAKNIANDIEGIVIVTKSGTLLVDNGRRTNVNQTRTNSTAVWVDKKKKRQTLKILDRLLNRTLLFGRLGIYTRLGTPCDDMIAPAAPTR